jgi:hypothetical protein
MLSYSWWLKNIITVRVRVVAFLEGILYRLYMPEIWWLPGLTCIVLIRMVTRVFVLVSLIQWSTECLKSTWSQR